MPERRDQSLRLSVSMTPSTVRCADKMTECVIWCLCVYLFIRVLFYTIYTCNLKAYVDLLLILHNSAEICTFYVSIKTDHVLYSQIYRFNCSSSAPKTDFKTPLSPFPHRRRSIVIATRKVRRHRRSHIVRWFADLQQYRHADGQMPLEVAVQQPVAGVRRAEAQHRETVTRHRHRVAGGRSLRRRNAGERLGDGLTLAGGRYAADGHHIEMVAVQMERMAHGGVVRVIDEAQLDGGIEWHVQQMRAGAWIAGRQAVAMAGHAVLRTGGVRVEEFSLVDGIAEQRWIVGETEGDVVHGAFHVEIAAGVC